MTKPELVTAYRAACAEAARFESLLANDRIKSTADWWLLQNARTRRDELLNQLLALAA